MAEDRGSTPMTRKGGEGSLVNLAALSLNNGSVLA